MSKDVKIWLVIMAVYLGLVGGMIGLTSRIEHPLEEVPPEFVPTILVTNSYTTPLVSEAVEEARWIFGAI